MIYLVLAIGSVVSAIFSVVAFLFETWVVQAVFGAWVVFALQKLHQSAVQRAERFQRRYDQKLAAIQTFFKLVDKRIYATRTYRAALLNDDGWLAQRELYRAAVQEWNEQAPSILVTLITLLPARLCFQLERNTFRRFAEIDSYLARIRRAREVNKSDKISAGQVMGLLAELSELSSTSLAEFLALARKEAKLIDQQPSIDLENEQHLSTGYLIMSLFKPAINR
jgi:hypothetical protein